MRETMAMGELRFCYHSLTSLQVAGVQFYHFHQEVCHYGNVMQCETGANIREL